MSNELLLSLSAREHEVLRSMFDGTNRRETANQLQVSAATIDNHIASICRKLRAH